MPRIEIRDASGISYRIDSFDWNKIRDWLAEWAPRIRDPDVPLMISVQPLFPWLNGAIGTPDWNADTRFFDWFQVPWEPDEIMAAIEQRRQAIEQAKAQGVKYL